MKNTDKKKIKGKKAGNRQIWKAGNMLYPLPAVMVSASDKEGNSNILTVAWTGTVCSDPAMLYISVRPDDSRDRGICGQPDHRRIGLCY